MGDYLIARIEGLNLGDYYGALAFSGDRIEQLGEPAGAVRCSEDFTDEALLNGAGISSRSRLCLFFTLLRSTRTAAVEL